MGRDFTETTITECDDIVERYGLTRFEDYIVRDFPKFSEPERVQILQQWDTMMANQQANERRPTKEFAGHLERKRRLDSVHFLLKKHNR